MKLNLRRVPEGNSRVVLESDLDSLKNDLPPLVGRIKCQGNVNRTGTDIFVQLEFSGVCTLQCSRCLNDYNSPFKGEVSILIKEVVGKHGKADDDDEVDFYYDNRNDDLDISSALYDEIMVGMPLMPLCSNVCTGVEINDSDIVIEFDGKKKNEDKIDPRWEALRKLKK